MTTPANYIAFLGMFLLPIRDDPSADTVTSQCTRHSRSRLTLNTIKEQNSKTLAQSRSYLEHHASSETIH